MARITRLFRYPLKGAVGRDENCLWVNDKIGIINDRICAIKRKPTTPDGWHPKAHFYVCMNTAKMAIEVPSFVAGYPHEILHRRYLERLARKLGVKELSVSYTKGEFSMTDSTTPYLSILNLATVKEFSKFVGREIDPRRFRMNAWMTDLSPCEEYTWVDTFPGTRRIKVGATTYRVDDACERCKAIEANPITGEYDIELMFMLDAFMKKSGYPGSPHRNVHRVMGILAVPESPGIVEIDDEIGLA